MYGDVTPNDVTHEDVKSDFIQFFKTFNHALINVDKMTEKNRLAVSIFQVCNYTIQFNTHNVVFTKYITNLC